MPASRRFVALVCFGCFAVTATQAAPSPAPPLPQRFRPSASSLITAVSVTQTFFNPALKQTVTLYFDLAAAATVAVNLLDRDRVPVRHFPARAMEAGGGAIEWDGRDDSGGLVPNEAYTARIEAVGPVGTMIYDPADHFVPRVEQPPIRSYSRGEGVLSYILSRPARVHIQAGQARRDPRTGEMDGPVLKTVVDRQPRVAGSVIEVWNGMDETGAIYVPALPHFVIAVLATSLPENALIVAGGAGPTFAAYAAAHRASHDDGLAHGSRGATAARAADIAGAAQPHSFPATVPAGAHHAGLSGIEDRSPRVALRLDGTWDPLARVWRVSPKAKAQVTIPPEEAPYFLAQPQTLTAYLDETAILRIEHPRNPQSIELPGRLPPGEHRLVVNWASSLGPVGLSMARIVAR